MFPRIPLSWSLFRSAYHLARTYGVARTYQLVRAYRLARTYRLARRPSGPAYRVAAATLLAVAGLSAVHAPAPAAGNPGAASQAAAGRTAGHAAAPALRGTSGPALHTIPAHASRPRPGRTESSSWERPHQKAASQHSDKARHKPAARHRVTRHRPAAHRHARPARPYLIYDSVTPVAIPAHHVVAAYATGHYAASASQVAGRGPVLWIDTTGVDHEASVLDVEPGDATPATAASWAWRRLKAEPNSVARIYTMRSEWPAVQAAMATLPSRMRSHIRWWIADPTGSPHIVPGADATQWYWGKGYDISTATPGF